MRMASTIVLAALFAAAAACEKKSPPTPSPGPGGVETIRGTERIGWDQGAADTVELATFRYAIYVDGARQEMAEVSCGSTSGASGFACSGRLPAMSPGQHTLELAAFVVDGGSTLESSRSVPLRVNVTAALAGLRAGSLRAGFAGTTSDGVALRLDVIVAALDSVSDFAFDPDGRLFIAERDGVMRIVEPGGRTQARSTADAAAGEILGLAIDPQFERTRHVFIAQAVAASDGAEPREVAISRYREINGVLGQRMVLLRGVPARTDRASAALAVGPDGRLYVALDDGGDPASADAAAMLNGKVLRLNRDGTTPDGPPGTPVFLKGCRSPRALEWTARVLWIADGEPRSPERLIAAVTDPTSGSAHIVATYALPPDTDPSDVTCYRGDLFPSFRGDLFVSAEGGSQLLRVKVDPRAPARIVATERLLEGIGPIRSVAVGPEGGIYVATETSIARLSPARRIPDP